MLSSVRSPQSPRPVAVDLFAGAGGLSLGLEQAGFEVGAAVEFGARPAATHRRNFSRTPVIEQDVRTVDATLVIEAVAKGHSKRKREWNKDVVLTAGGPPCQGYSVGGHRRVDDVRNSLVHEFWRLVTTLQSRYFVMENVPGMLLGPHKEMIDGLVDSFCKSGYDVADPFIVDASRLGVPQVRRRVLLVGWKRGENAVDVSGLQRVEVDRTSVADALDDLPEIENIADLLDSDVFVLRKNRREGSAYAQAMRSLPDTLTYKRPWDRRTLTGCARTVHDGEVVRRFESTTPGETEPVSRYRRLSADGLAPTIRAGTGPEHGSHTSPRPIHHRTPRVISVREAARLQSFPDWFRFSDTKWHAWQEIGNSVPPLLAREVGKLIMQAQA